MNPDRMAVVVRPRTSWEALDLGFAMARHWFVSLTLLWWLGALPVYLISLWLFSASPWAVLLVVWWLKPAFEPPLIFWISRALFGEKLSLREMGRQWWRIVTPRLLANLSWNRFDLNRAYHMPVTVLEGLRDTARKERLRILGRHRRGGGWLSIVGYHMEAVLMFSTLFLLYILIPEELRWLDWESFLFGGSGVEQTLQQLAYLVAMSIIAPFYVAGGFALYLNRRTELEAWDIELRFRRIAARQRPKSGGNPHLALLLILLLPLLMQPADAIALEREEARVLIEEVVADKAFGTVEERGYWHYIEDEPRAANPEGFWKILRLIGDLLSGFFKGIATVGELILWVTVGVAAALLIHWIYRNREWLGGLRGPGSGERASLPVELFGLELAPESLPADIPGEALRLLEAGDSRGALSLLYRGALSRFIHQHQLEIPRSATEGECIHRVEGVAAVTETALFRQLTGYWVRLAYGHITPDLPDLQRLCGEWRRLYPDQEPARG